MPNEGTDARRLRGASMQRVPPEPHTNTYDLITTRRQEGGVVPPCDRRNGCCGTPEFHQFVSAQVPPGMDPDSRHDNRVRVPLRCPTAILYAPTTTMLRFEFTLSVQCEVPLVGAVAVGRSTCQSTLRCCRGRECPGRRVRSPSDQDRPRHQAREG